MSEAMKKSSALCAAGMLCLLLPLVADAEGIARVESVQGVVSAEREGQPSHVLAPGSTLDQGDTIVTQHGSHAKVVFTDQTQVAVRPNSRLQLVNYAYQEKKSTEDSFVMHLLKGGMRQVTGLISRNKGAYQLRAHTATIGIRGTDFVARLCDGPDCEVDQAEAERTQARTSGASGTVGKVVWVQGEVEAVGQGGKSRKLSLASPLFEGDVISSGADGKAGFVMQDNARLVLPPRSSLRVTEYRFVPARAYEGSAAIDLLKGGMRVVTGLLGRLNRESVTFRAATATIGIRGTAFDMVCASKSVSSPEGGEYAMAECGGGGSELHVSMRSGEISLNGESASIVVAAGQSAVIPQVSAKPEMLSAPPVLLDTQLPKPEDIKVDAAKLFGLERTDGIQPGVYISVNSGEVVMAAPGGEIQIARGEAGFTGVSQIPVRLPAVPAFMDRDSTLSRYNLSAPTLCQ